MLSRANKDSVEGTGEQKDLLPEQFSYGYYVDACAVASTTELVHTLEIVKLNMTHESHEIHRHANIKADDAFPFTVGCSSSCEDEAQVKKVNTESHTERCLARNLPA